MTETERKLSDAIRDLIGLVNCRAFGKEHDASYLAWKKYCAGPALAALEGSLEAKVIKLLQCGAFHVPEIRLHLGLKQDDDFKHCMCNLLERQLIEFDGKGRYKTSNAVPL